MSFHKLKLIIFICLVFGALIGFTPLMQTEANTPAKVLDIKTFPEDYFMNFNNLKPGDITKDTINIKNNGNINFSYQTTAEFLSGSKEYFNQLLLQVNDESNKTLYLGKLKDFTGLQDRTLKMFESEKLSFQVEVPFELGNEFQELETKFVLRFTAEEAGNTINPNTPDEEKPPNINEPPNSNELPTNNTGSLPQTGEENPIFIILSGLFISLSGIVLLLVKKSIITNPFKRG